MSFDIMLRNRMVLTLIGFINTHSNLIFSVKLVKKFLAKSDKRDILRNLESKIRVQFLLS